MKWKWILELTWSVNSAFATKSVNLKEWHKGFDFKFMNLYTMKVVMPVPRWGEV